VRVRGKIWRKMPGRVTSATAVGQFCEGELKW